jgi:hypothetical protein
MIAGAIFNDPLVQSGKHHNYFVVGETVKKGTTLTGVLQMNKLT